MSKQIIEDEFNLYKEVLGILETEPFFTVMSRIMHKTPDRNIPTAGVCSAKRGLELRYNQDFMSENSLKCRAEILKHEFFHICFGHIFVDEFKAAADKKDMALCRKYNIAFDLAVNSFLDAKILGQITKDGKSFQGCIPGVGDFKDLPTHKSWTWYFSNMPQKVEESLSSGAGGEYEFDIHDFIDGLNEAERELLKAVVKDSMQKAAQECSIKNQWGSVSSDIYKQMAKAFIKPFNWEKYLEYFINASIAINKYSTVRKINKRFPYIHPGKMKRKVGNIAIAVDESGSVSDEQFTKFWALLDKLSDIVTFTIFPFDADVDESKSFKWEKGKKIECRRDLCGGTDFRPVSNLVDKKHFDGLIILTDMWAEIPKKSATRRMWLTCSQRGSFEEGFYNLNEPIVIIDEK